MFSAVSSLTLIFSTGLYIFKFLYFLKTFLNVELLKQCLNCLSPVSNSSLHTLDKLISAFADRLLYVRQTIICQQTDNYTSDRQTDRILYVNRQTDHYMYTNYTLLSAAMIPIYLSGVSCLQMLGIDGPKWAHR